MYMYHICRGEVVHVRLPCRISSCSSSILTEETTGSPSLVPRLPGFLESESRFGLPHSGNGVGHVCTCICACSGSSMLTEEATGSPGMRLSSPCLTVVMG